MPVPIRGGLSASVSQARQCGQVIMRPPPIPTGGRSEAPLSLGATSVQVRSPLETRPPTAIPLIQPEIALAVVIAHVEAFDLGGQLDLLD